MPIVPIRPIRIDGNIAHVPLTQGYEAIIDAADVPIIENNNWFPKISRKGVIYARKHGENGRYILMHRYILSLDKGIEADHRDHDGLNNRRCNLRIATRSQNNMNLRMRSDNTSGFKGVHFFKRHALWQAQICKDGKKTHLGYFKTPEEAHAVYCNAAQRLHGDFAKLT